MWKRFAPLLERYFGTTDGFPPGEPGGGITGIISGPVCGGLTAIPGSTFGGVIMPLRLDRFVLRSLSGGAIFSGGGGAALGGGTGTVGFAGEDGNGFCAPAGTATSMIAVTATNIAAGTARSTAMARYRIRNVIGPFLLF